MAAENLASTLRHRYQDVDQVVRPDLDAASDEMDWVTDSSTETEGDSGSDSGSDSESDGKGSGNSSDKGTLPVGDHQHVTFQELFRRVMQHRKHVTKKLLDWGKGCCDRAGITFPDTGEQEWPCATVPHLG